MKKIILGTLFLAVTSLGFSQTYVSSGGNDTTGDGSSGSPYASVSKAVTETSGGGTIIITGTISQLGSGENDIDIDKNLTFQGESNAQINGNGTDRYLSIASAVTVVFEDITFDGFETTTQKGSVLFAGSSGDVTFRDCVFSNNQTSNSNGGGALNITNATITIENCSFVSNRNDGGPGGALAIAGTSTGTITGSTFYQNSSSATGGAVIVSGTGSGTFTNCTVYDNFSDKTNGIFNAGGVRINDTGASGTFSNCLFYDNTVSGTSGTVSDVAAPSAATLNFTNSMARELVNEDSTTGSTVSTSDFLSGSSLTWNATTNQLNYSASSSISDDTPIDFGSDNSDVGAWDSQINLFEGTTDSDWATGANWSSTAAPTSSENATLLSDSPSAVIASSTAAVCNDLSVNASSSLTINAGGSLIVSGSSSGDVTYNRSLDFVSGNSNGWYLVGSPVAGVTFNDTFVSGNDIASGTGSNRGVATYTTSSDSWSYLQSGGSIASTSGIGYSMKRGTTTGTVAFTGTINTADVTPSIATTGNGFNLMGNPYTSYINSATFLTDNTGSLDSETIWLWNQGTGNYETKITADSYSLSPGQGFFIKASSGSTVNFAESNQSSGTDSFQRTSNSRPEVHLFMTNGTTERFAKVYYINGTTTGFDNGYDGETFNGQQNAMDVYTHLVADSQGRNYQIQSLPDSDYENMVIPVGVTSEAGTVTFSLEAMNLPSDYKVFLEDKETDTFIRLDEVGATYDVNFTQAVSGIGRFYMHVTTSVLSTDDIPAFTNLSTYISSPNNLRIVGIEEGNTQVRMFNILGKEVLNTRFEANGVNDVTLPNLRTGIYILQLNNKDGKINRKLLVE